MTRHAWLLIAAAYALLAIGAAITLALIARQADQVDLDNSRLAVAAGVYCEVGRLPDPEEALALRRLASLVGHKETFDLSKAADLIRTPDCRVIYAWLRD